MATYRPLMDERLRRLINGLLTAVSPMIPSVMATVALLALGVMCGLFLFDCTPAPAFAITGSGNEGGAPSDTGRLAHRPQLVWPVQPVRVERGFIAPLTEYGPGHRGIDVSVLPGVTVVSPADATVTFVGRVVDRDVVSLSDNFGRHISFEPMTSSLEAGAHVVAGSELGQVGVGPHCRCLHIGVRINGAYISPMREFDTLPRAVLLPW